MTEQHLLIGQDTARVNPAQHRMRRARGLPAMAAMNVTSSEVRV
jgi:hypothetical protein